MPMPPRQRASRLRPESRRALIVEAAIRVAARVSLAGLSVAAVADEAGLSKAAVFRYFPERAELVAAVLDDVERYVWSLLERARGATDDPVRMLVNLAFAYSASLQTHFEHVEILLASPTLDGEPEVVERIRRIFQGYVAVVEEAIRDGIGRRLLASDIDVELAAWTYVGYPFTLGIARLYGRPPEWIYHLQLSLLRMLFGHEAIDRIVAGTRPKGLVRRA